MHGFLDMVEEYYVNEIANWILELSFKEWMVF